MINKTIWTRVALALSAGPLALLSACGGAHPVSYQVQDTSGDVSWVQGCEDDDGNRIADELCDSPHVHAYPVYGQVYGDGMAIVPIGGHYTGSYSRNRPNVNITNIVNHTSVTGGTIARNGTGTAVTKTSTTGAGKPVTPRPAAKTGSGRVDQAPAKGAPAPSSTITRGGLGVPSAPKAAAPAKTKTGK